MRQSRALDLRGLTIRLTHGPTGITVEGNVPDGHHSRGEMRRLKSELEAKLLAKLSERVAIRLRLPRR